MTDAQRNIWRKFQALIKRNVDEINYQTWFKYLKFESFDAQKRELLLNVPSQFFYEYLEEHFRNLLHFAIKHSFGEDVQLTYQVSVTRKEKVNQKSEPDKPMAMVGERNSGRLANQAPAMTAAVAPVSELDSRLNYNLNFNNFIEGASNFLPRRTGLSVAEKPEQLTFNPLFIYGPSGVGKTHLVNAIGTRLKELYPQRRVLYVSAHLLMMQYTDAVTRNVQNDFMHFYQSIETLIVDDVQELMGKPGTQYALFHIFNHLKQNGRQIILTSDRPPHALSGMEDRMITRFNSGLLAALEKPEEELRRNILEDKVKRDGLLIPEDVIQFISHTVCDSVRELEGVVQSLMAYSVVYNRDIDLDLARRVIRHSKPQKKVLTLEQIVEHTCSSLKIRQEDVYGKSRKAPIVLARQLSMYLAQRHTNLSASKIGVLVGNRDHATVLHSVKTIQKRLNTDMTFKQTVSGLEQKLKERT